MYYIIIFSLGKYLIISSDTNVAFDRISRNDIHPRTDAKLIIGLDRIEIYLTMQDYTNGSLTTKHV